jgi:hypothetical protein
MATLMGLCDCSGAQADLVFDANGTLYATTINNRLITLNTPMVSQS